MLWLVVLIKLLTPPVLNWPWSPPRLWATAKPATIASPVANQQKVTEDKPTAPQDREAKRDEDPARPAVAIPAPPIRWNFDILGQGLFGLWLGISATIALWQIGRIVRFHRRLSWVIPAPEWLVQEVRDLSGQLGVRAPRSSCCPISRRRCFGFWAEQSCSCPDAWCRTRTGSGCVPSWLTSWPIFAVAITGFVGSISSRV